jgi:RNA polymerase sigma-70 factor (ECF subfamily)
MSSIPTDQLSDAIGELRRYAKSLTRDPHEADDLVQDTVERALRKQHLYVSTSPLIAWLQVIMYHLFITRLRRLKRRSRVEGVALDQADAVGLTATPPNQVDYCFLGELGHLIDRLPRGSVEVLLSVALEGRGYTDVAARLRLPLGTIRSRLSRSRAALCHAALMMTPDRSNGAPNAGGAGLQPRLTLSDRRFDRAALL